MLKKVIKIICVFWFSLKPSPETLFLGITELDIINNEHCCTSKVPVNTVTYLPKLNFLSRFLKTTTVLNLKYLSIASTIVPYRRMN
jgi:hypothetical protein